MSNNKTLCLQPELSGDRWARRLNERTLRGKLNKRNEATEACARKNAQSEWKNWGSMWTLTQESYRDEAETVCHNCFVGGSAPQTQKDAFHNLLTGAVRHWMREDYLCDWAVDRPKSSHPPDINRFKHSQQTLAQAVMQKCSITTTKL